MNPAWTTCIPDKPQFCWPWTIKLNFGVWHLLPQIDYHTKFQLIWTSNLGVVGIFPWLFGLFVLKKCPHLPTTAPVNLFWSEIRFWDPVAKKYQIIAFKVEGRQRFFGFIRNASGLQRLVGLKGCLFLWLNTVDIASAWEPSTGCTTIHQQPSVIDCKRWWWWCKYCWKLLPIKNHASIHCQWPWWWCAEIWIIVLSTKTIKKFIDLLRATMLI